MSWASDKLGLKQIGQQARADIIMLKELAALELLAFQTGRFHCLIREIIETAPMPIWKMGEALLALSDRNLFDLGAWKSPQNLLLRLTEVIRVMDCPEWIKDDRIWITREGWKFLEIPKTPISHRAKWMLWKALS